MLPPSSGATIADAQDAAIGRSHAGTELGRS
jgi:hypothetical protein